MLKHRLYVDEVGNSDLGASQDINHRYLSLTGVVLELGYVDANLYPRLEALKKHFFGSHADEPVVLHRKELIQKKAPFERLRDPSVDQEFAAELTETDYVVITAVIDKLEHQQKYAAWRYDPYHYCLHVVLERYILWMRRRGFKGDVMAESRGKKEDMRLKKSFQGIWERGTDHVEANQFQDYLTSRELKMKPKANNIAGLQLADIVAYPAWKVGLAHGVADALPDNLTGRIGKLLLTTKFDRSQSGHVIGWGLKRLP